MSRQRRHHVALIIVAKNRVIVLLKIMEEFASSIYYWASVALFQAVVHCWISGLFGSRNRSVVVQESRNDRTRKTLNRPRDDQEELMQSILDKEEPDLDGDEPDIFFQLLSETGSEMTRVRSSCATMIASQDSLLLRCFK